MNERTESMRHGGDLSEACARHGGAPGDWLDLSTGINPHAWPLPPIDPVLWQSLPRRADLDALLAAARAAYGVPADLAIVAAPGTQALIQWLPRLAAGGGVAIAGPTYGEHETSWRAGGHGVEALAQGGDLPEGARHGVIVHPNNPDGALAGPNWLRRIAAQVEARGGWLVLDESFVDTAPHLSFAALAREAPVIVLRSFGKFHGLAGLRLGFAIARPEIADLVEEALGPWSVAGPALAIGAKALADAEWARDMRVRLEAESGALDNVLEGAGLAIAGGTSLFRLARHPQAGALHLHLAQARIWTRCFAHDPGLLRFGLPASPPGLARLAGALKAFHGTSPQGTMTGASSNLSR